MAIVLDIQIGGKNTERQLAAAQKSFDKMEDSVAALADLFRQMAGDSRTIAGNMGRAGGGGGRGRRSPGGGSPGAPPVARFTRGPAQRLMDLQDQRQAAGGIANPSRRAAVLQDIQRAEFLAKRSITLQRRRNADPNAVNRPGLLELFETLNSRIGRLGGRGGAGAALRGLGGAGGALAGTGPLAAALAVVTVAVVAWTAAVKTALKVGRDVGRGAAVTGSTIAQFQAIQGVAALLGTDAASLARGVSGGTKGGLGGAVGASLGISPIPRAFDTQSDAAKTKILIDAITQSSGARAQFIARATDQEELLTLRNLTPGQLTELQNVFDQIASTETVKAAASLDFELVKLQATFQRLATSDTVLGLIRGITAITDVTVTFINTIAEVFNRFPFLAALLGGLPGAIGAGLGGGKSQKSINELEMESRERMISAMDEWGRIAKDHAEVLGGDVRARRALPPGAGEQLVYGSRTAVFDMELGLL